MTALFSLLSRQFETDRPIMARADMLRAQSVALLQRLANSEELDMPNQRAELRCLASRDD